MDIPAENKVAEHLCSLAKSGDLVGTKRLIEAGADVNTTDRRSGYPLFHACYHAHTPIVRLLLEAGADVNVRDAAGCTPLHWACMSGKPDILALVMERVPPGMDVNEEAGDEVTPLHLACKGLSAPIVHMLLEKGADPAVLTMRGYRGEAPVDVILMQLWLDDDKKAAREQTFEALCEHCADAVLERALAMEKAFPNREKTLDWFRERYPELVMEMYCAPGPQSPSL